MHVSVLLGNIDKGSIFGRIFVVIQVNKTIGELKTAKAAGEDMMSNKATGEDMMSNRATGEDMMSNRVTGENMMVDKTNSKVMAENKTNSEVTMIKRINDLQGKALRNNAIKRMIILAHRCIALSFLFTVVFLCACDKKPTGLSLDKEYAVEGETIKAKATGIKGNQEITWYLDGKKIDVKKDSYTVTSENLEKVLEVKVVDQDGVEYSDSLYLSKLPVLYIETENGTVGDNDYSKATLAMQGAKGYELTADNSFEGDIEIKLRGNSTRYRYKSPYKIKLSKKTDLFNMGKSKHWVLLADDIDHTLIRNQLVLDFAREIGMETASKATKVVLFMDGDYRGVYTLCEQVRIGEDQVDVYDWGDLAKELARASEETIKASHQGEWSKEDLDKLEEYLENKLGWITSPYTFYYDGNSYTATDFVDIPEATGGFLLEADFYYNTGNLGSIKTNYLQPFYFNSPDRGGDNFMLIKYARNYIQAFEYSLHSDDFKYHEDDRHEKVSEKGRYNSVSGWTGTRTAASFSMPEYDGYSYRDFFDMDSLVNYFFVNELTKNWDSMKNSLFVYKDIDAKACIGPAWDYDWSFGNINMYGIDTYFPTGWHTTDVNFTREQHYQQYNWYRYLIKDPEFVKALYEKWQVIRPTVIEDMIKEGGTLDTWYSYLYEAGKANDRRWKFSYTQYGSAGYVASYDNLREFIEKRIRWLDIQFQSESYLYDSLNE